MNAEPASFRHGVELLGPWPEWRELLSVIGGVTAGAIETAQAGPLEDKPVGAQRAINYVFKERLTQLGWNSEVLVFPTPSYAKKQGIEPPSQDFPERKIDFMKNHLGIEIAFNHESYLERILFRLNVASEADGVIPGHEVVAGIIVVASDRVKRWGRMDPSVATYEGAQRTLEFVRHSFSVPLILVGLFPDDEPNWPEKSSTFWGNHSKS